MGGGGILRGEGGGMLRGRGCRWDVGGRGWGDIKVLVVFSGAEIIIGEVEVDMCFRFSVIIIR